VVGNEKGPIGDIPMVKPENCVICGDTATDVSVDYEYQMVSYKCGKCGAVSFTRRAADDFPGRRFSDKEKAMFQMTLRNQWERTHHLPKALDLEDLGRIVSEFKRMDALEMMDDTLLKLEKSTGFVGEDIVLDVAHDYPYYNCYNKSELSSMVSFLDLEGLIDTENMVNGKKKISLRPKAYQRIREIRKSNEDSRRCFVAMWFGDEMKEAYEKAIKPAIEFIEDGETEPRFRAVKIDDVEHLNDINDEIIAQIRRSRFMVCDLTGYRGGVYFEAGFAYGLGMDVIYTCRKDWTKAEPLRNGNKKKVEWLFDSKGSKVHIQKEGVHFDLDHRNRIEWTADELDTFKVELENRIKATIV
jgi:hypothetical protein